MTISNEYHLTPNIQLHQNNNVVSELFTQINKEKV